MPPLSAFPEMRLLISTKWVKSFLIVGVLAVLLISTRLTGSTAQEPTPPVATPEGPIATDDALAAARAEWAQSAHAETYDNGMGANTTCASCKSPQNWDPSQEVAQQQALDCGSCKRVPGSPRPELDSGVAVPEQAWFGIPCEICHIPAGDSYYTGLAFWNQAFGHYETVETAGELCAHCHEGQHGFEVVEEQEAARVHTSMDCVDCHGAHGSPSACEDCHDPTSGPGALEHARHQTVNCTACHDAGKLSVWYDRDPQSKHYEEYITRRFAHTLTSWPSHNLQTQTVCQRCHHPQGQFRAILASKISCVACHPDGAVLIWCENFPRDFNPLEETRKVP